MRLLLLLSGLSLPLIPPLAEAAETPRLPATPAAEIDFGDVTVRAFDRSGKHVTASTRSDGTTAIALNGSFQNVTVARVGPDGSIETHCTTDEHTARAWMARETGTPARTPFTATAPGDGR